MIGRQVDAKAIFATRRARRSRFRRGPTDDRRKKRNTNYERDIKETFALRAQYRYRIRYRRCGGAEPEPARLWTGCGGHAGAIVAASE
jgi:hypothetical protein